MAQASPTTCAHNAPGQTYVGGRPIPCRQCGALIQPSPRAVDAGGRVQGQSAGTINALYPADSGVAPSETNDPAWAFSQ